MIEVVLSHPERFVATVVGAARQLESALHGRRQNHGCEGGVTEHILGAAGEMAFCRARGIYWEASINSLKRPDIGNIQIRTRTSHYWDLIVREDDDDSAIFVLVTCSLPLLGDGVFRVHGSIRGAAAKRPEWLQARNGRPPTWFVPQGSLTRLKSDPALSEMAA